jgi:hypothetical protein
MDGAGMALLESAGFAGMPVGWDSARPVAVQSKAATINVLFMTNLLKALGVVDRIDGNHVHRPQRQDD